MLIWYLVKISGCSRQQITRLIDALACQQSNHAADQLQKAKQHLFNLIYQQQEQLA